MRRLWLRGPAIAQMVVIFVASSIPDLQELPGGVSDKTGHAVGYFLLAALVYRAMAGARWAGLSWSVGWRAWLISAAYGASDEFHQRFVPGRTPAVDDWIADASGAAVAILLFATVSAIRAKGRAV